MTFMSDIPEPEQSTKDVVDILRVQTWFWAIATRLGVTTAYAVEKYYRTNSDPTYKNKKFEPSKRFKNYEKGLHVPHPGIVRWFDEQERFKGTRQYIDHPFWVLLKTPDINIDELYILLGKLPYHIYKHIFDFELDIDGAEYQPNPDKLLRKAGYLSALKEFDKYSNLDSLAATLGLICEAKHFSTREFKLQHATAADTALRIFLRIATENQFICNSDNIFSLLRERFLTVSYDKTGIQNLEMVGNNLGEILLYNMFILGLINQLHLLKDIDDAPPACLYLSEKHLTQEVMNTISYYGESGEWSKIKKIPEVKNLSRSLRRWEKRQPALFYEPSDYDPYEFDDEPLVEEYPDYIFEDL
jgi:hypothetical protein